MSNKKNLVSIIIPIYNSEKYLNRCLSSITEQTYSNIEIVLIDDGSTDDSRSICLDWKSKDDRILVFSKENGGQGSARNYGIKVASGEYIVFVDSDDYIHPQMIEVLIHAVINHAVDIVQCSYQEVAEGIDVIDFDDIKLSEIHCAIDNDRNSRYLCCYTEDIIPGNKFYRVYYNRKISKDSLNFQLVGKSWWNGQDKSSLSGLPGNGVKINHLEKI